jgi:hypothetical protein
MAMFDPPRRRFPWLRVGFLALVAVTVVAVIVNPRLLDGARGAWAQGRTLIDEVTAEPRVTGAAAVSAHDYVPLRAAAAGRAGANVRDYPLLSGDLVVNLPAAAPLHINGRLNVQGMWWFRVVLDDGTLGFVRQDVVQWGAAIRDPMAFRVGEVSPVVSVRAGANGARIRSGPGLDASAVTRLSAGEALTVDGKLKQDEYWWLRVRFGDDRVGFAREDVLVDANGAALSWGG